MSQRASRIEGLAQTKQRILNARNNLEGNPLGKALLKSSIIVAGQAQRNVTGGGSSRTMLNVRTGRLRQSIKGKLLSRTQAVVVVGVKYGRIHEEGGVIKARRKKFLHFVIDGKHFQAKTIRIPARPYLAPALQTKRKQVSQVIRQVYAGPLNLGGGKF